MDHASSNNYGGSEYITTQGGPENDVSGLIPRERSLSQGSIGSQISVGSFSVHDEDVYDSRGDGFGNPNRSHGVAIYPIVNHKKFSQAESSNHARVNGSDNNYSAEHRRKGLYGMNERKQGFHQQTILTEKATSFGTPQSSTEQRKYETVEQQPQTKISATISSNYGNSVLDKNLLMRSERGSLPARTLHQHNQLWAATVGTIKNEKHQTVSNVKQIWKPNECRQQHNQQQGQNEEVIELLDDDDVDTNENQFKHAPMNATAMSAGMKRPRPSEKRTNPAKTPIVPGSSIHAYQSRENDPNPYAHTNRFTPQQQQKQRVSLPQYFTLPTNHRPTWEFPLPPLNIPSRSVQPSQTRNQYKHFELSLLNVSEFTITGLPLSFDGKPSSVVGFRKVIKEVSKGHGKPIFERYANGRRETNLVSRSDHNSHGDLDNPDGGKWRIPLGAYRAFFSYLNNDSMCKVQGIPEHQLKIASLGKARLDKGYPSAHKIISYGVPKGLAMALAPFQRGGVDFVVEKEGRALIADDMGLGKTIQSIASMSIYHDEWPLLILTPSTARYHWAAEFSNWLGSESAVNNGTSSNEEKISDICEEDDCNGLHPPKTPMRLLKESEIHVMVAGKEKVFPTTDTRVVVCSYGLATSLIESEKIYRGLFKCAIVDESHMLKNIKTKRTSKLIPILHATNRCILLSGTPAFARPAELWPQLKILSTERDGWWEDEGEFVKKYVQRTSAIRRAELHTMLIGTVMIRRLKHNILKSLPSKQREKAVVDVVTPDARLEFQKCMKLLREGKGVMAKIAKKHADKDSEGKSNLIESKNEKIKVLMDEYDEMYRRKLERMYSSIQTSHYNEAEKENLMAKYRSDLKNEVDLWYKERLQRIEDEVLGSPGQPEEDLDRKSILNKMYSLTAKAKIPLIAKLVTKWLDDPTKGKLCIFAHHIFVLDEISKLVGLSNEKGIRGRFIRIDGSTNPKERQAQIVAFQNDPDIRIAVLGITAAGVAVTLTASSTVWFAELFWTPALMIQAEDRCHRIGQNATVKCLYFVATGTLDVLLWDLLEKKFQDLGEFVEGKEKMKIVVQNTFKSIKELDSIFVRSVDDETEDDARLVDNENPEEGDDLIKLENDLQDDIGQLAQEEMIMISQGEDEDGSDNKVAGNSMLTSISAQTKSGLGQTEQEAICLSDDEGDTSPRKEATKATTSQQRLTDVVDASRMRAGFQNERSRVLENYRVYKQYFDGSSFGIQLLRVFDRLVIAKNISRNRKPALGDVLVAVNGQRLPLGCALEEACKYMKTVLNQGTVELTFVEDEAFVKHTKPFIIKQRDGIARANAVNNQKPQSNPMDKDEVIEILD